jgi:protein ImuA
MRDSTALIARLRHVARDGVLRQGDARADDAWLSQGLARAQLHEIYAANTDESASAAGFAVALTLAASATPVLWLRTEEAERRGGRLHAAGLVELGVPVEALILGMVPDEGALLRAASDGARCAGLGTLVVEVWGRCPGVDLTATRRLMLAAEASGVTVLLLRIGAESVPSAAATRWGVAAAASTPLEADAPGVPAFDIELQRRRGGPAGRRWRVEWNRDACRFEDNGSSAAGGAVAPLSGAGVPLAADRTPAWGPPAPVRRSG